MRRYERLLIGAVTILVLTFPAAAQTYEVLYAFTGANGDGAFPLGKLLPVGADFYGTTNSGGDLGGLCFSGCGTIFRLDSSNTVTTIHAFDSSTEGFLPQSGLIAGGDGNYYGTTTNGGLAGDGTVFRVDDAGNVLTIHDFDRDTEGGFTGGRN